MLPSKREAMSKATNMKMICYSHANKTHFHQKCFAVSFVLKVGVFGTWKWPISRWQIVYTQRGWKWCTSGNPAKCLRFDFNHFISAGLSRRWSLSSMQWIILAGKKGKLSEHRGFGNRILMFLVMRALLWISLLRIIYDLSNCIPHIWYRDISKSL